MTDQTTAALAAFARDMSTAFARLAVELGGEGRRLEELPGSVYGPATMRLPWSERLLRQSLILHEIQQAGGSVPTETWKQIAAKYGYTGRGCAGFFRQEGHGLLEMRKNSRVYITRHGRERLAQNRDRVDAALAHQLVAVG